MRSDSKTESLRLNKLPPHLRDRDEFPRSETVQTDACGTVRCMIGFILRAMPDLLPPDGNVRRKAMAAIRQVLSVRGEIIGEIAERLQRIARLLGVDEEPTAAAPMNVVSGTLKVAKA